jgi:photosystem II stability/assembly factor-like uncharacterized protein
MTKKLMNALSLLLAVSLAVATAAFGQQDTKQHPLLKPVVSSLTVVGGTWSAQGPAPIYNSQGPEGITNKPSVGAINSLVAHPTNADILWIGSVNGGIWKTTNATSSSPSWTPLTDSFSTLAIRALERDWNDSTNNTLVAGAGSTSSFGITAGSVGGLLRTTDGGTTWTALNPTALAGKNITALAVRGSTIVASLVTTPINTNCLYVPIYRSTDTGATFSAVSGLPAHGEAYDLASDPSNSSVLYAATLDCSTDYGGVYKSSNSGATWTKVSTTGMDVFFPNNMKIAVGPSGEVFAGIYSDTLHIYRSLDHGSSWTQLDSLAATDGNLSMAVDATNGNILYFGEAGMHFPNSIGATEYSGYLWRVNAGASPGFQLTPLTHCQTALSGCNSSISTNSNSAPHADSRAMAIDHNGNLLETDDGGIYRRTNPTGTGDWVAVDGSLQLAEMHDVVYDHISKMIMGGDQDTGTPEQTSVGGTIWTVAYGTSGDGGDVAADDMSSLTQSTRYASSQGLINFIRRVMDSSGAMVSSIYPSKMLLGGSATLQGQFVTPVELNRVDMRRVLFAGYNDLYESLDRADTMTALGLNQTVVAAVYGGTSSGVDNLDLIWAIANPSNTPAVYVRTSGGGAPAQTTATPGTALLNDIAVDTADWHKAYVINASGQVYSTSNTGASWTNITGNLGSGTTDLRTIAFVPPSKLVVGGLYGVFVADTSNPTSWNQLGSGLPNALVYDLDYDAIDDVLVASTLGRSAWKLNPVAVSGTLPSLSINDVTVTEGNSGTTNATFTVSLSAAANHTVAVNYATADGSAVGQNLTFLHNSATQFACSCGASPYPSQITVSGVLDPIKKVTVNLNGFASGLPNSADLLLVGPGGQTCMLMSDAGGTTYVSSADLKFDDAAASQLSQSGPIIPGTYRPTDYEAGDTFYSPAPAGPYGSSLSAFNGTSANGTWSLYIVLDTSAGQYWGNIDSWSLTLNSGDYTAGSGQLVFAPGTASKTITVPVYGDTTVEANETFYVNLSSPSNATIADSQGAGTILNDDADAPTSVQAAATTATNVHLTWNGASGAATYRVYRSSGSGVYTALTPTVSTASFDDSTASANTAYLYKVRSIASSGAESSDSNFDLATTVIFAETINGGFTTFIKSTHFSELLTAVNAVRTLAGSTPISFTTPAPASNALILGAHVTDLRNGLNPARAALGLAALTYTDPTIVVTPPSSATPMKAAHVTELRSGVQ